MNRNWFEELMGFKELPYEETQAKLEVVGSALRSRTNDRCYGIGVLETPITGSAITTQCAVSRRGLTPRNHPHGQARRAIPIWTGHLIGRWDGGHAYRRCGWFQRQVLVRPSWHPAHRATPHHRAVHAAELRHARQQGDARRPGRMRGPFGYPKHSAVILRVTRRKFAGQTMPLSICKRGSSCP